MEFTGNCYKKVIELMKEADKIIVGFGREWRVPSVEALFNEEEQWKASLEFQKLYDGDARTDEENEAEEITVKRVQIEIQAERLKAGYQAIKQLIEEKDYFLITTNPDAFLYRQGFWEERIVAPCGDIRRLQCEEAEHEVWSFCAEDKNPVCPVCGRIGKLNVLQNVPYHESGYLKAWEVYQRWIQKAMNKKIVLLELGEGFQTPTVMRWPFEKLVFFQEKAILCCVHENLSMVSEEIGSRAYSVAENSVDFAIQLGTVNKELCRYTKG